MGQWYIGLIHKEPGSDYGVSFPDFPGIATAGRTFNEALAMAEEALHLHIEGMREDGDPIPEPSSPDNIMQAAARQGAIVVPVLVDGVVAPLSADLLGAIDRHAERRGFTRSDYIAEAAKRALEMEDAA